MHGEVHRDLQVALPGERLCGAGDFHGSQYPYLEVERRFDTRCDRVCWRPRTRKRKVVNIAFVGCGDERIDLVCGLAIQCERFEDEAERRKPEYGVAGVDMPCSRVAGRHDRRYSLAPVRDCVFDAPT